MFIEKLNENGVLVGQVYPDSFAGIGLLDSEIVVPNGFRIARYQDKFGYHRAFLPVLAEEAPSNLMPVGPPFVNDQTSGWTFLRVSADGARIAFINSSGVSGNATYTLSNLEEGVSYLIEIRIEDYVSRGGFFRNCALGGAIFNAYDINGNGLYSYTVVAGSTNETLRIVSNNGDNFYISEVKLSKTT